MFFHFLLCNCCLSVTFLSVEERPLYIVKATVPKDLGKVTDLKQIEISFKEVK